MPAMRTRVRTRAGTERRMLRPVKRSFTIDGHRTSISLEAPFWDALREIAAARRVSVASLVQAIDSGREGDIGLSGAVRVYVLEHYRTLARQAVPRRDDPA